jgi:histone acetyltransferase (RNA polymerase elongator complex component)
VCVCVCVCVCLSVCVCVSRYGCTRVQIGLQHTDNGILELINRQCTNEQGESAIKMLKEACFKVDLHMKHKSPLYSDFM